MTTAVYISACLVQVVALHGENFHDQLPGFWPLVIWYVYRFDLQPLEPNRGYKEVGYEWVSMTAELHLSGACLQTQLISAKLAEIRPSQ